MTCAFCHRTIKASMMLHIAPGTEREAYAHMGCARRRITVADPKALGWV